MGCWHCPSGKMVCSMYCVSNRVGVSLRVSDTQLGQFLVVTFLFSVNFYIYIEIGSDNVRCHSSVT